jgi:competence protein ComEC
VRLLVPALAAWGLLVGLLWAGVGTAGQVVAAGLGLAVGLGGLLGPVAIARGHRCGVARLLGATGAACALAATALAGHGAVRGASTLDELAADGATVVVEGRVEQDPRLVRPRANSVVGGSVVVTAIAVDLVTGRGRTSRVSAAPVLVLGDLSWTQVSWRQVLRVTGRLTPSHPGEAVFAVLRPSGPPVVLEGAGALAEAAELMRDRFRRATSGLPPDAAGLVPALVIGDSSATPADLTEAMLATGMSHLSAVSGSNIAIVAGTVLVGCRALGVRRRWRPVVVALAMLGFVVLARPEPSVLRATAMGLVGLIGLSTSRKRAGLPALAATILVLLCWDPWLARSYGFALSVLATVGLLLLAAPIGSRIAVLLPARLRGGADLAAVPLAAQVFCAPVAVLLQGTVSLVAVPANLAAGPLVAPATVAGVVVMLVCLVWPAGAQVLAGAAALPAIGIAWIARTGAGLPYGSIPWPAGPFGAVLLAALLVGFVLAGPWLARRARRRPLPVLAAVVLALSGLVPLRDIAWPLPAWQVAMCDVGQGDAVVLATAPGRAVLVDAGPAADRVTACLDRLGVTALDAVVLTHFHGDHVDGLPGVLRTRTVGQIVTSPVAEPAVQSAQALREAAGHGVPVTPLYAGDVLAWGSVRARVWGPARLVRDGSIPNNASLVLAADVAGLTVLLLGDVEREAAADVLAANRADPWWADGVDVLKVAHHGSANRDDALYSRAEATVALVSVGSDNDYGHPAPSTMHALARTGARIYRTDEHGDVAVRKGEDGAVHVAVRGR